MDITEATMRGGLSDCLKATLDKSNIPTYVGIGGGLVAGNAVGKKLQSFYDNSVDVGVTPNKWIQFGARTAGRLLASGVLCAISGSLDGEVKETMQMGAVGAAGFVAIDTLRTFGAGDSWIDDYLTLQGPVTVRRATRISRATPRPVALQSGRPAMETAALQPEGALMRTASLRV